jgi:hypothetical protein
MQLNIIYSASLLISRLIVELSSLLLPYYITKEMVSLKLICLFVGWREHYAVRDGQQISIVPAP